MKILLSTAAVAASLLLSSAASAQTIPAAVVAIVNLEKVTADCTACKSASAALRSQVTAYQNREKTLATPLETESKALQAAVEALKGAQPDAALQARVRAFQQKQQQGAQELQRQQQQIQRNSQFVQQQIAAKLGPIYQSVMQRRGANIMVETGTTLASGASLDVTNDVLAALNAALPSVNVNAPAQAAPQGR
jgi:Skp family chaperone for outer membrane proteins